MAGAESDESASRVAEDITAMALSRLMRPIKEK